MELIPEYKNTEVGIIPKDWNAETIGQYVEIKSGESPSLFRFALEGTPYFKVEQLNSKSRYVVDTPYLIQSDRKVARGSLIFPKRGASILLNKIRILAKDSFMDTNLMTLTPKATVHSEFLYYALTHIELWRIADTTSIPQINNKHITPLVIPLPPTKVEQAAIAEALSDADALIESLEQLLVKKRLIKQGAMQELLSGEKRLPGFSEKWIDTTLSDICRMESGEGITSAGIDDYSKFPCYGGNGLRGYAKRYTHDGNYALVGRQGALCGNVVAVSGKFFASEHAIVVTPLADTDIGWLALVLARMNLNQYSESSAQPGLSVSKLLMLPCVAPPRAEQTAIAEILSDMDADIAALEEKITKARRIKQGMMAELLTGRIRLV